ncbi:MAG: hypothetical protein CME71_02195 [Halobacteriovorax sp.]|nr:hypothetical protein [Halobacteriovorax sp.]
MPARKMQTEFELFRINQNLNLSFRLSDLLHKISLKVMKSATNLILLNDLSGQLNEILNPTNLKLSVIDSDGIVVSHYESGVKIEDHEFMGEIRHGLIDYSNNLIVIDQSVSSGKRRELEHAFGQKLERDKTYLFLNHECRRELFATFLLCFDRSILTQELNFISKVQALINQRIAMNKDQSILLDAIEIQTRKLNDLEEKLSEVRVERKGLKFYEV